MFVSLRLIRGALLALLIAMLATPASAQALNQESLNYSGTFAFEDSQHTWDQAGQFGAETVNDHVREGYRPGGIRLPGGHLFFPAIAVGTRYDDNLFLDQNANKVADARYSIAPNFVFQSNLPQHMFNLTADAEAVKYQNHSNFDHNNGGTTGDLRIDIDAADSLRVRLSSRLGHDTNFLPVGPEIGAEAMPIWSNYATVGYTHDAGRTAFVTAVDWQRFNYYDTRTYNGGLLDNSADDNTIMGGLGYVSYRWSPGYRGYVGGRYDRQVPLTDRATFGSNSKYSGEIGLEYEWDRILKFNFAGGYQSLVFDNSDTRNVGTFTFSGGVQWQPTQRITVNAVGSREIQRTKQDPNGIITDRVRTRLQYDIFHNIVGTLDVTLERDAYNGSDRLDTKFDGTTSLDYWLNENLALTLSYEHTDRVSNESQFDYTDNRVMATLTVSQ